MVIVDMTPVRMRITKRSKRMRRASARRLRRAAMTRQLELMKQQSARQHRLQAVKKWHDQEALYDKQRADKSNAAANKESDNKKNNVKFAPTIMVSQIPDEVEKPVPPPVSSPLIVVRPCDTEEARNDRSVVLQDAIEAAKFISKMNSNLSNTVQQQQNGAFSTASLLKHIEAEAATYDDAEDPDFDPQRPLDDKKQTLSKSMSSAGSGQHDDTGEDDEITSDSSPFVHSDDDSENGPADDDDDENEGADNGSDNDEDDDNESEAEHDIEMDEINYINQVKSTLSITTRKRKRSSGSSPSATRGTEDEGETQVQSEPNTESSNGHHSKSNGFATAEEEGNTDIDMVSPKKTILACNQQTELSNGAPARGNSQTNSNNSRKKKKKQKKNANAKEAVATSSSSAKEKSDGDGDESGSDIDSMFDEMVKVKKKQGSSPKRQQQLSNDKAKSSEVAEDIERYKQQHSRSSRIGTRKFTEEGFRVLSMDEIKADQPEGLNGDCPFDCSCCF